MGHTTDLILPARAAETQTQTPKKKLTLADLPFEGKTCPVCGGVMVKAPCWRCMNCPHCETCGI